jgi:hypothetical protein
MAYTSTVTIEELDQSRAPQRTLILVGPGLPKMGANWGFENVLPTTWYPGNPFEATQQVLVAKELPSDWEGEWNITRLNRFPSSFSDSSGAADVISPGFLVDVFEDMGRKGNRLRVTWIVDSQTQLGPNASPADQQAASSNDAAISRTIVREGRIKQFNAKYTRSTDVEWQVSFSWQSRGGTQQRVVATRDGNVDTASSALFAALTAAQLAVQNLLNEQATQSTLGQLEQLARYPLELLGAVNTQIENALFDIGNVAGIVTEFRNLPFNLASQVVDIANDIVGTANLFTDSFSRTPIEQQILSDQVSDQTRAQTDMGQIQDQLALVARQGASTQAQMRDAISTNPGRGNISSAQASGTTAGGLVAVRICKAGDTPQSVSRLYYGTIDHDIDILRANHLPWYQSSFDPGSLIVIPTISSTKGP